MKPMSSVIVSGCAVFLLVAALACAVPLTAKSTGLNSRPSLLQGARNAEIYLQSMNEYREKGLLLVYTGGQYCGQEWYQDPANMKRLYVIATARDENDTLVTLEFQATDESWTTFTKPHVDPEPFVGSFTLDLDKIEINEAESFNKLNDYIATEFGNVAAQYTQVTLRVNADAKTAPAYYYDTYVPGNPIVYLGVDAQDGSVSQDLEIAYCPAPKKK